MRKFGVFSVVVLALGLFSVPASATAIFEAVLTGGQQVPAVNVTGSGMGKVVLNDAMDMITVDLSWTGLTGPAMAAHIHNAPAGVNGPVIFPFTGVPSAISGSIPEQSFSITQAQVTELWAGALYFNVHTAEFPGGEIRGQIEPVPEPATVGLLGLTLTGFLLLRRRRKAC